MPMAPETESWSLLANDLDEARSEEFEPLTRPGTDAVVDPPIIINGHGTDESFGVSRA